MFVTLFRQYSNQSSRMTCLKLDQAVRLRSSTVLRNALTTRIYNTIKILLLCVISTIIKQKVQMKVVKTKLFLVEVFFL